MEYRNLGEQRHPCVYGPFGSAQRDRIANSPEALGKLVQAHASASAHASLGDDDGVHSPG
jgi:hypothetical protein